MLLQLLINQNQIPLFFYLNISSMLFILSIIGIIWNLKNLMILLIFIELMFFSINLQFIFIAANSTLYAGFLYSILNLVLAAAESVIGLTLLILIYRINDSIDYYNLTNLRH